MIEELLDFAADVRAYSLVLRELRLGGGLRVPYVWSDPLVTIEDYVRETSLAVRKP
jgi:hypothetical protein